MIELVNLEPFSLSLNQFRALEVSGYDSLSFLNSQTTNNVKNLKVGSFQFDALLDVSAKIETYFITLKKDIDTFYLLIPTQIYEESITRIEKFHISEDVEFIRRELEFYLNFFTSKDEYVSNLGSFEVEIASCAKAKIISNPNDAFTFLGLPILNETLKLGEIFNNTLLNHLAIDFNKGCFIGQETVSKIHTRRGAAKAPVFVITDQELDQLDKLKSFTVNIGEILYKLKIKNLNYYLCLLTRENRVNNKEVFIDLKDSQIKTTIKTIPLFSLENLSSDLYLSAVTDFQNSNEQLAIKKLKNIISANPSFYDAYESLGVIYGRQEKFSEAIEIMHKLESSNPKSVMAQTNLSMFYMKIGEIDKAEVHKSNATVNQFAAFGDIADEKRAKEEQEKKMVSELKRREEMFKQVLAIDPKDALATFGLGELRLSQNRLDEAKDLLQTTINTDAKYSVAYLALSKTLIKLEEISEAIKVLELGISISSKNGDLMPANEMQSIYVKLKSN